MEKSAVISKKKYYCPVCSNIEEIATNHYGEIYPKCKNCDNSGMYLDDKEHGYKWSMEGYCVKIVPYRFDIGIVSHMLMYMTMKGHLIDDLRYRISESYAPQFGKSQFHEDRWNKSRIMNIPTIKAEQFESQYITKIGRLYDWYEFIYPNKDIKSGYYLIHPHNKNVALQ